MWATARRWRRLHTGVVSTPNHPPLPRSMAVFERGWLSSNSVLLVDSQRTALVDTGYCTHAGQTLALVQHALGSRTLDDVLNTHLHSDHCGGNAALQVAYPGVVTAIPPGQAAAVAEWHTAQQEHERLGQSIVRFGFDRLLQPGTTERLGGQHWEVHAAPGHDHHAVLLFEPASRTLISGDALWQNGFGVVFPELDGQSGFAEVGDTLNLIEQLDPVVVVPGHGSPFGDVPAALVRARKRLDGFLAYPAKHQIHAAKVMLKFKLLEWQRVPCAEAMQWADRNALLRQLAGTAAHTAEAYTAWLQQLVADLCASGAAELVGTELHNR